MGYLNPEVNRINNFLMLRGSELYHSKYGIGFYGPEIPLKYREHVQATGEISNLRLSKETQELAETVRTGQSVLVEGGLGAGKSTLIYGLRIVLQTNEHPYFLVNGHFPTTNAQKIEAALKWAHQKRAIVLWDSLDYLLIGTTKARKLPLPKQRERTTCIAGLLTQYIDSGVTLVGTSHTQPWINRRGDPNLIEGPWQQLIMRMGVHQVRGVFENSDEIIRFYYQSGLDPTQASFLANAQENPLLKNLLLTPLYNSKFGEVMDSLSQLRIAKLITSPNNIKGIEIRTTLNQFANSQISEAVLLKHLVDCILMMNQETRIKTEAPSP